MFAFANFLIALGLFVLAPVGLLFSANWFLAGLQVIVIGLLMRMAFAPEDPERARPDTHVRCPDCRELVRKDATKCKHCGTALVAQ